MTDFTLTIDGYKPWTSTMVIEPAGPPTSPVQLYMYKEDIESGDFDGNLRGCAMAGGCPAVHVLRGDPDTLLTRQWQYYLYAINQGMTLNQISSLMGPEKALTNTMPGTHWLNYLTGENLSDPDAKLPRLDKLRTFSRNVHTGVEVDGKYLRVKTMDGNYAPPLKPGRTQPHTLAEVNLDDYLYNPRDNREMFLVCNNVRSDLERGSIVFPFAHGLVYDWTGTPDIYTFFPLVSWFPEILSPLWKWVKLPLGAPIPSPYRR